MKICVIDPGASIGIAIAQFPKEAIEKGDICLDKYILDTLTDSETVVELAVASGSKFVIIERQPPMAVTPQYNEIYLALTKQEGYIPVEPFSISSEFLHNPLKYIFSISPGLWKPFMASRKDLISLSDWVPASRHERDTMRLLMYFMLVTFQDRKILYV